MRVLVYRRLTPATLDDFPEYRPVAVTYYSDGQPAILALLDPEVGQRHAERDDARAGEE